MHLRMLHTVCASIQQVHSRAGERDDVYRSSVSMKRGGTDVSVKITCDVEKIDCLERRLCGYCGKRKSISKEDNKREKE